MSGNPWQMVKVCIAFGTADNLLVVDAGVDQFLVSPNAAVVWSVEASQPAVEKISCQFDGGIAKVMPHIEQAAASFAIVNDTVDWVLLPAINTL